MGEKLKPMPTSLAPDDSSHQSVRRNHRRVVRQDVRPCSPDLHGARNEISVRTTTNERSGAKFGIGPCKISDLTKGGKIRLEEHLPCAKRLEVDAHLAVFDHCALKTARAEPDINGEIYGSLSDQGHGFDKSAQP